MHQMRRVSDSSVRRKSHTTNHSGAAGAAITRRKEGRISFPVTAAGR